ncbi:hypothetical protein QQ045_033079 [Rhodiola kirilowii]
MMGVYVEGTPKKESGQTLRDNESSMTYNIVVGGWSRFGKVDEMEKVMEVMRRDGFSPDCLTYSYFIEGLGKMGRVDDFVKLFDDLENRGCV